MRAIEFRVWDDHDKEMIYMDDFSWFDKSGCMENEGEGGYILLQYTGLQDAKGNKVFEGDVIQGYWNEYYPDAIGEIVFKDGKFQGVFKLDVSTGITSGTALEKNYIVIGNKYQHEELLNEQKTTNVGTDRDG